MHEIPCDEYTFFITTTAIPKNISHNWRNVLYVFGISFDLLFYLGSGGFISGISGLISREAELWLTCMCVAGGAGEIIMRKVTDCLKRQVITFSDAHYKLENLCAHVDSLEFYGVNLLEQDMKKIMSKVRKIATILYAFLKKEQYGELHKVIASLIGCTNYSQCIAGILSIRHCVHLASMSSTVTVTGNELLDINSDMTQTVTSTKHNKKFASGGKATSRDNSSDEV
jgi:hypothetical protein